MADLSVLSVASEVYPLVKTGGLADVVGALPAALAREGVAVRTLIPGYPSVIASLDRADAVHHFPHLLGGPATLLAASAAGLDLFVLVAPHLYARPGGPYSAPDGNAWGDNGLRFAALAQCAAAVGRGAAPGFAPDVVQAHDWQAGLAPAYLHYAGAPRPCTVMTVHNLAFQGQFPADLLATIGLPAHAYAIEGVEYYGSIGYLKAGLALADRITTVSPTYAAEIRTDEGGMGLGGLLRARSSAMNGIVNGVDDAVWNPATDAHLTAAFDARHLGERALNKAALQARLGLDVDADSLLFGVVSRLTWQKGIDLVRGALETIHSAGAQFALLGSGDPWLEGEFATAARRHPRRIAAVIGYDESLAHLMQGGADALLVPSRFEPCGLTQLCALRYGALPVVARVGGLADTVVDADDAGLARGGATGFQFAPVTGDGLQHAIHRALALWRNPTQWRKVQARAMATDVGWTQPARQYAKLFRQLVRE